MELVFSIIFLSEKNMLKKLRMKREVKILSH